MHTKIAKLSAAVIITSLAVWGTGYAESLYEDSYNYTIPTAEVDTAQIGISINRFISAVTGNAVSPVENTSRIVKLAGTFGTRHFQTRLDSLAESIDAHDVTIQIVENPCGVDSLGCVMALSPSVIQISSETQTYSDSDLLALLAHEYAHTLQNRLPAFIVYSPGYMGEYGYDLEWNADCMAIQLVGYAIRGYDYECSDHQLSVAEGLWRLNQ